MEAIVEKIVGNRMGTTNLIMKIKGMRKSQDFVVYPISKDDSSKVIKIQSDTRIGLLDLDTGKGKMSKSHPSGAYFHHLQTDKLTEFKLSEVDLQALRLKIFTSNDKKAGSNGIVHTDNSGAKSVFDL